MTTRTRQTGRSTPTGRFARQQAAPRALPRPPARFARRQPQKSTTSRAVNRVTGLLPRSGGKSKSRGTGGGKKAGGFAALAGAAALAFKNRDRLTSMLGRKTTHQEAPTDGHNA